jgi:hypothetical protein
MNKTRSSHIAHNTNQTKPQGKHDNMDTAYQSVLKHLSIYITEKIQWNVHVQG